jgi:uncharacterized membrane protein YdcZ (DUF606 family)
VPIALLSALNAVCWGFAIREVGDPLSLDFVLRLAFNKWYVLALASALVASFLSYVILREVGVLAGEVLPIAGQCSDDTGVHTSLRRRANAEEWAGVALIIAGTL